MMSDKPIISGLRNALRMLSPRSMRAARDYVVNPRLAQDVDVLSDASRLAHYTTVRARRAIDLHGGPGLNLSLLLVPTGNILLDGGATAPRRSYQLGTAVSQRVKTGSREECAVGRYIRCDVTGELLVVSLELQRDPTGREMLTIVWAGPPKGRWRSKRSYLTFVADRRLFAQGRVAESERYVEISTRNAGRGCDVCEGRSPAHVHAVVPDDPEEDCPPVRCERHIRLREPKNSVDLTCARENVRVHAGIFLGNVSTLRSFADPPRESKALVTGDPTTLSIIVGMDAKKMAFLHSVAMQWTIGQTSPLACVVPGAAHMWSLDEGKGSSPGRGVEDPNTLALGVELKATGKEEADGGYPPLIVLSSDRGCCKSASKGDGVSVGGEKSVDDSIPYPLPWDPLFQKDSTREPDGIDPDEPQGSGSVPRWRRSRYIPLVSTRHSSARLVRHEDCLSESSSEGDPALYWMPASTTPAAVVENGFVTTAPEIPVVPKADEEKTFDRRIGSGSMLEMEPDTPAVQLFTPNPVHNPLANADLPIKGLEGTGTRVPNESRTTPLQSLSPRDHAATHQRQKLSKRLLANLPELISTVPSISVTRSAAYNILLAEKERPHRRGEGLPEGTPEERRRVSNRRSAARSTKRRLAAFHLLTETLEGTKVHLVSLIRKERLLRQENLRLRTLVSTGPHPA